MKLLTKLGIVLIVVGIVVLMLLPIVMIYDDSLLRGGYFDRSTMARMIPGIMFITGIVLLIASAIRWKKKSDNISDELQELKDKVERLEKDKEKKDRF